MARLIQAVQKYGPKVERVPTATTALLARHLAGRTGLHQTQVNIVLDELLEAILHYNSIGMPVKLNGIGTFGVSVDRHGRRRVTFLSSGPIRRGLNSELTQDLVIRNSANIGISNEALKELWDAEHPEDPLEMF
jgi:nucleoid DNA-binding protein